MWIYNNMMKSERWTWNILLQFLGVLHALHRCYGMTMDEIIAGSMTSPNGFDFIYDEASDTVRVDLDMLYFKQEWDMLQILNESTIGVPGKRQAIQNGAGGRRWTDHTVPYEIDTSVFPTPKDREVLHDAMNDWMAYTCVNFRPKQSGDKNMIKFVDGDGCASYVGMQQSKQNVLLASGCRQKGIVIHELGHALGLHHEQTRPDREEYVKSHYENIPDHLELNFKKYSYSVIQDLGVPYDYTSIMHYGKTYFAEDKSKPTIETLDKSMMNVIGNRVGLSFRDIKTVNKMYNCRPSFDCRLRDSDCKGEGFVGMDCKCWCPAAVSAYSKPYVHCDDPSSGNGQQGGSNAGSNTGGSTGGNTGAGQTGGQGNGGQRECEDRNRKCRQWASQGHCTQSKSYMYSYCRRSCNRCGSSGSANPCIDLHQFCGYWGLLGHCVDDYAPFMVESCKKTCGFCNRYDQYQSNEASRECIDEHKFCSYWRGQGHCRHPEFRDYMALTCKVSCGLCPINARYYGK